MKASKIVEESYRIDFPHQDTSSPKESEKENTEYSDIESNEHGKQEIENSNKEIDKENKSSQRIGESNSYSSEEYSVSSASCTCKDIDNCITLLREQPERLVHALKVGNWLRTHVSDDVKDIVRYIFVNS